MFNIFKKEKNNFEGDIYKVRQELAADREEATKVLKERIEKNNDSDNLKIIANLLLKILLK